MRTFVVWIDRVCEWCEWRRLCLSGGEWKDTRVQKIYGGTNEIMKELISRSL